jgi:hypothetical protein
MPILWSKSEAVSRWLFDYEQFGGKLQMDVAHEQEVDAGAAIPLLYCH